MQTPTPVFRARRAAFTLIELLTVIAIIGILAAILIPTVSAVRGKGQAAKTVSNLRQIQAANNSWAADNKGFFMGNDPTGGGAWGPGWFAYGPYLRQFGLNVPGDVNDWGWQNQGYPELLRCGRPVSSLSFEPDGSEGDRIMTIAMNMTSWTHRQSGSSIPSAGGWGAWGWWTAGKIAIERVQFPSQLIMFYESGNFYGTIEQREEWQADGPSGGRGLAFRNGGYANVVFADGHVGRFKRGDMTTSTLDVRRHWWVWGGNPGEVP